MWLAGFPQNASIWATLGHTLAAGRGCSVLLLPLSRAGGFSLPQNLMLSNVFSQSNSLIYIT